MEWWKLFTGTFVLIFLAELGDKTQLAAMAKTADSPEGSLAKWVVFLGASLALVTSTFIAVFLGQALKSLIPDERYIRIAAGGLFLVFGFLILYETYRSFRDEGREPPSAPVASVRAGDPGLVGALALRAAMDFETFAIGRYRSLAAASPELSALLLDLAREEEGHLARLRGVPEDAAAGAGAERPSGVSARTLRKTADNRGILDELIRHEQATAAFYQDLADRTLLPPARAVFAALAEEERKHARRLEAAGATHRQL